MVKPMAHEILVALTVLNQEVYAEYRKAIRPYLERVQASFRCDFEVSKVLKPEEHPRWNRVFVLTFPDRERKEAFFEDSGYRAVKAQLFEKSVAEFTILAEFDSLE